MGGTRRKVIGSWKYLFRAVAKTGKTIDFLLATKRHTAGAVHFSGKAADRKGTPDRITTDKNRASKAAIDQIVSEKRGQSTFANSAISKHRRTEPPRSQARGPADARH